jgi:hypothetical protein
MEVGGPISRLLNAYRRFARRGRRTYVRSELDPRYFPQSHSDIRRRGLRGEPRYRIPSTTGSGRSLPRVEWACPPPPVRCAGTSRNRPTVGRSPHRPVALGLRRASGSIRVERERLPADERTARAAPDHRPAEPCTGRPYVALKPALCRYGAAPAGGAAGCRLGAHSGESVSAMYRNACPDRVGIRSLGHRNPQEREDPAAGGDGARGDPPPRGRRGGRQGTARRARTGRARSPRRPAAGARDRCSAGPDRGLLSELACSPAWPRSRSRSGNRRPAKGPSPTADRGTAG